MVNKRYYYKQILNCLKEFERVKKQICLIAQPREGSELINESFTCLS